MKRELLIGLAIAGFMVGAQMASIVATSKKTDVLLGGVVQPVAVTAASVDTTQPGTGAASLDVEPAAGTGAAAAQLAPAAIPEHVLEIADLLEAAQQRVLDARRGQGDTDELPPGLVAEVNRSDWLKKLRLEVHERIGAGALMRGGQLTDLGKELMARLRGIEDHGLNPSDFFMPELEEKVAAFVGKLGGSGVELPASAGSAGPAMLKIMTAAKFNRDKALARLMAAGGTPMPQHIAEIEKQLVKASIGREAEREQMELEADLGKALVKYVLEFRFLRRAHPFRATKNERKFVHWKGRHSRILATFELLAMSDDPAEAFRSVDPVHPQYEAMQGFLKKYRAIAAKDCFAELPTDLKLQPEAQGEGVEPLKKRLECEEYFSGAIDDVYDPEAVSAAKLFQRHHELKPDGYIYEKSLIALNIPPSHRVKQIELALQRMRESEIRTLGDFYIRVNIPSYEMQVYDSGELQRSHRVIVGTNKLDDDKVALTQGHINRTRLMNTRLYEVIVNPDWIMPKRVERGEVKAKLADDPNYLEKNNIKWVTLGNGKKVLIQGRGDMNVLGQVKFMLEESHAIFLHDTNKPHLFDEFRRDFSHGCVRVHRATEFAKWLLHRDGWDKKDVRMTFKRPFQRGMKLKDPIPLLTEYVTVDVSEARMPVFLTDIYDYDQAYFEGELPVVDRARWGSNVLRPHWVPNVPEDVVNQWRAEGKSAPRNYDPTKNGG